MSRVLNTVLGALVALIGVLLLVGHGDQSDLIKSGAVFGCFAWADIMFNRALDDKDLKERSR